MNALAEAMRDSVAAPARFAAVYRDQFPPLLDRLIRRVWDSEIAVDLAAETIAEAFDQRRRFRGRTDAELVGWLNGIADRKLARFYRTHEIETRALKKLGLDPPTLAPDEYRALLERVDFEAARPRLLAELSELSLAQREAVVLRVIEEGPYAEVADRLAISEQAARARVARALAVLRANLTLEPNTKELAHD